MPMSASSAVQRVMRMDVAGSVRARGPNASAKASDQAEHDAKLREVWRKSRVLPFVVEVARGVGVGKEAALAQRHGDACNGDDGEEGHLEAGLEECARRPDEDAKCRGSESVERVVLASEQACDEEDGGHQKRALHGNSEPVSRAYAETSVRVSSVASHVRMRSLRAR